MAINYLKTTFVVDLLATIPFDTMLSQSYSYRIYKEDLLKRGGMSWIDLLGLFKLGRLLRLSDIISFLKASDEVKSYLKLLKMILFLMVYSHSFACAWWFVIKVDRVWIPPIDIIKGTQSHFQIYQADFST